jgi:hypothetical protein
MLMDSLTEREKKRERKERQREREREQRNVCQGGSQLAPCLAFPEISPFEMIHFAR